MDEIKRLVEEALDTDGAHHKQWYLVQIAKLLGINTDNVDEGIIP